MPNRKFSAGLTGVVAMMFAAAPILTMPAPALAQDYSPMPAGCQAASDAVQAEGNRYRTPPSSESTVVQMQHILFLTGLLLDALDNSCRGWADYGRSKEQFQSTYDATMKTCRQVASNAADCRRKAYGG